MGFRKGKGTKDSTFQLRMISERVLQMKTEKKTSDGKTENKGRKLFLCSWITRKRLIE